MKKYSCAIVIAAMLLAAGCTRFSGRTDQQVATDVQNKINADTSFPDKGLTINANNGVVTLSGNVSSESARTAAGNDAAQVAGVKTVINNLTVAPPSTVAAAEPQPQPEPQTAAQAENLQPAPARPRAKPSPGTSAWRKFGSSHAAPASNSAGNSGSPATAPAAADTTASAAPAPAPATVAPPPPQPVTVPSGTQLSIRLGQELNSETAQVGDTFRGTLSAPVVIGDVTVIPMTADVEGRVVDVKSAGRFAGQSVLTLQLTRLMMNGRSYGIQTDQWSKSGSGRGKSTAAKVGGGAAVGAILGGIFGGGKGAAIGATAGAGAGTGVSAATKGQQIVLKPEAVISFTLQNSLTVTPGSKPQPMSSSPSSN